MTTTTTYTREQIIEHRRAWLAALRSGEYRQGINVLRDQDNRFCCLGVACAVAQIESVIYSEDDMGYHYGVGDGATDLLLPPEGSDWLGIEESSPSIDLPYSLYRTPADEAQETGLAALNDEGMTFSQIADLIEYFGLSDDTIGGWKQ